MFGHLRDPEASVILEPPDPAQGLWLDSQTDPGLYPHLGLPEAT